MQIVAATDFSTGSHRALRRAGHVARFANARLTLLHVVDGSLDAPQAERECRDAERMLTEQIGAMPELSGVACEPMVTIGSIDESILHAAGALSASVIVMGMHRKPSLTDAFVGTVIERVVRAGQCPVLMVNVAPDLGHYRSVLAGLDMSDHSAHAVRVAQSLRLVHENNLTLVHAFVPLAKGKLYVAGAPQEQIVEYVESERHQAIRELAAFLKQQGLDEPRWSSVVDEGEPFAVLQAIAVTTQSDLVVIGTHGRSPIVKAVLGSVAEQALSSLDTDVLAVPPVG